MKHLFSAVFLLISTLLLLFTGCSSSSDSISSLTSISSQVDSFQTSDFDSVKVAIYDNSSSEQYILSNGSLSTSGNFVVGLSSPYSSTLWYLANIFVTTSYSGTYSNYSISNTSSVKLSNTAAEVTIANILTYKDGENNGYLYKSNKHISKLNTVGYTQSFYYYSSKELTVKGATNYTLTMTSSGNTATTSIIKNYNLNLQKGWNEVAEVCDSYSFTTNTLSSEYTYTTTIPADLVWRWASSGIQSVKRQSLPGLDAHKF